MLPGPGHPSNLHGELLVFDWEYVTKTLTSFFLFGNNVWVRQNLVSSQEIDVLVGGRNTEADIIDPGSQIVAIQKDLAEEVAARIDPSIHLEMEGANGATNQILGYAEHLAMQVGDIPFILHAHVVEQASSRLLLGQPFQHLLLCNLEEKPDGHTDITVHDPRDRNCEVSIPSCERRTHTRSLSYQTVAPPPKTFASSDASPENPLLSLPRRLSSRPLPCPLSHFHSSHAQSDFF